MMTLPSAARRAFSLLELSIVLVILGLIVGAFMAGDSIMASQKLRSITTAASKYMIAMNQFKVQYGYLAGDFPNAVRLWGRADGGAVTSNCTTPDTEAANGKATCNGNGDGNLAAPTAHETYRAWQHLFDAGFLDANYTGIKAGAGALNSYIDPGTNVPTGPYDATGYAWQSGPNIVNTNIAVSTDYFDGDYSNALFFGKQNDYTAPGGGMGGAALRPQQMIELDTKSDDGNGSTGNIRAYKQASCISNNTTQ